MTGKEILKKISGGEIPPRIPFAPTIYEHGATLLKITPSALARDAKLIAQSQLLAYQLYRHDIVTVGVDIYNIEAEALGCKVRYYGDHTLPSIEDVIIKEPAQIKNMELPDPSKAGRMPVLLEACEIIHAKIGTEVPVSTTVTGPFTLAAILRGFENFLMDLLFDEEFAREQLAFASRAGLHYAKALISRGIGVSINESWITPPMLSPDLFRNRVLAYEKELIAGIKDAGAQSVALISGGNTTPIAEYLVQTGTSLLMADANTDQKAYKKLCERANINLRASIDSKIVEAGDEKEMEEAVKRVVEHCAANGRFIFGCGVVSANTPPEHVLKLKRMVERANPYMHM